MRLIIVAAMAFTAAAFTTVPARANYCYCMAMVIKQTILFFSKIFQSNGSVDNLKRDFSRYLAMSEWLGLPPEPLRMLDCKSKRTQAELIDDRRDSEETWKNLINTPGMPIVMGQVKWPD